MITILHYIYWFLIFNVGIFYLLGFPTSVYKISIPFVGLTIFFLTLVSKGKKMKFPLFSLVIIFILISVLSNILNDIHWFSTTFFLFSCLLPYFYFLVIINESDLKRINKVSKWIVFLILLQIPAILLKYILIGQSEKGAIGTLSIAAGSLSTIFPVFIVAFLICYYFLFRRVKYLLLIICFILFALIGNKRAVTYLIPLEFAIAYILYLQFIIQKVTKQQIRQFVVILVVGFVSFYAMVRLNPSLNKDEKIGGRFDIDYLINYSETYTSSDGKGKRDMRRKDGLIYFYLYNVNSQTLNQLLGDGAGILYQSLIDPKTGTMEELYGVRYGGRMGIIWMLLQVGILGLLSYLLFLGAFFIMRIQKSDWINNIFLLGFIVASIFMLFDFMFYSNTFISLDIIKHLYFFAGALLMHLKACSHDGKKCRIYLVNSFKT